jgi:hypothetical protein
VKKVAEPPSASPPAEGRADVVERDAADFWNLSKSAPHWGQRYSYVGILRRSPDGVKNRPDKPG